MLTDLGDGVISSMVSWQMFNNSQPKIINDYICIYKIFECMCVCALHAFITNFVYIRDA